MMAFNVKDQKCIFLTKKDFMLNLRTSNFSHIARKIRFDTRFLLYIFLIQFNFTFLFQDARQTIWRLSFVNPIGGTIHSQFVSLSFFRMLNLIDDFTRIIFLQMKQQIWILTLSKKCYYLHNTIKILLTSSTYQTMLRQLPSVSRGSTFLPFFCKAEFKVFFALTFFHSGMPSNEIKNSESGVDKLASIPAKSHFVNLAYYGSYVFVKLLSDVILETFSRENNLIKVCHHVDFYILENYLYFSHF